MKSFHLTIFILFSYVLLGQKNITSTLTADHIPIQTTHTSMIPPSGFTVSKMFAGFESVADGASIMVVEIPAAFEETTAGFTAEGLKSQGMDLKEFEQIAFNGLPAKFVTLEQQANGQTFFKYALAFGTAQYTVMINGILPIEAKKKLAGPIKKAMLSTVYDEQKAVDPMADADFTIDTDSYGLHHMASTAGAHVFNRKGESPDGTPDDLNLVVAKSISRDVVRDRTAFAKKRLNEMPLQVNEVRSEGKVTVNGIEGYEIIADGHERNHDTPLRLYQLILYVDDHYYVLFGQTSADLDANERLFKEVCATFELK